MRTIIPPLSPITSFFFFNDPATTEIYTLSLHDALPICRLERAHRHSPRRAPQQLLLGRRHRHSTAGVAAVLAEDRQSTRLNSSHVRISYAVFCLKKKSQRGQCGSLTTRSKGGTSCRASK